MCSVHAYCIQSYITYRDKIKQKNLNNVSNVEYNKTSIWFVTLAISIVNGWAPDTIKIRLSPLIIAPYLSNFATIFDHFISQLNKLAVLGRLLGTLRTENGDGRENVAEK